MLRGMMSERDQNNRKGPDLNAASTHTSGMDHGTSSAIGRRLKAYYDDVASEPVPDRFLSLLNALDAVESKSRSRD